MHCSDFGRFLKASSKSVTLGQLLQGLSAVLLPDFASLPELDYEVIQTVYQIQLPRGSAAPVMSLTY